LFAGPEGAIVTEYANYHDGNGLRFTNPNVEFTDVLAKTD
jgi:D-lyxose ketol-isomerase